MRLRILTRRRDLIALERPDRRIRVTARPGEVALPHHCGRSQSVMGPAAHSPLASLPDAPDRRRRDETP